MFIVYSVFIITLFISNSKACKGSPHKSLPSFRGDKIGQISQLDLNAFEVCDIDRNGLTWKEVSSCIVRFTYVHTRTTVVLGTYYAHCISFQFHLDVINIRIKFGLKLFFASIQIRLGIEWSHRVVFDRVLVLVFLWP